MGWAEAITAASAAVTAGSVVWGISAWRREYVGKRRIELAETVLALFYEAEDVIKAIRSPFAYGGEGKSRKRSKNETEEQSEILDNAYVAIERYQSREKLFAELMSLKYRTMVTFSTQSREPFDELNGAIKQILFAARKLGTYYWPRQGKHFRNEQEEEKFLKRLEEFENMFWEPGEEDDKIGPVVHQAVEKIEAITKEALQPRITMIAKIKRKYN